MMLSFKVCIHVIFFAIAISISQHFTVVAAESSSSAITIRRVNFDPLGRMNLGESTDAEFPFISESTLFLTKRNLHAIFFTLVPSAEAYEGDWLSEAIRFSLEFSCRKADLQEISNFYIKDGEYDITYADDVTFGDGKWQVNFEPRRLYPDAASGEELELFSKINVFDPSGKQHSAIVRYGCFISSFQNNTICTKRGIKLQEGDVESFPEE